MLNQATDLTSNIKIFLLVKRQHITQLMIFKGGEKRGMFGCFKLLIVEIIYLNARFILQIDKLRKIFVNSLCTNKF